VSIEVAAVVWPDETVWVHEPGGRTAVKVPDSQSFWDKVWENRGCMEGIAHTHPGSGWPAPSHTDVSTFEAMEKGIGRRLSWWILSSDRAVRIERRGTGYEIVEQVDPAAEPAWMEELRKASFPR